MRYKSIVVLMVRMTLFYDELQMVNQGTSGRLHQGLVYKFLSAKFTSRSFTLCIGVPKGRIVQTPETGNRQLVTNLLFTNYVINPIFAGK